MIVTVCADKGSPGVTWTSVVLTMTWPGHRALIEADVSGSDLALRLKTPTGSFLPRQPTIRGLSVDTRSGVLPSLSPYVVNTSLSIPVVPATDMGSDAFRLLARHWHSVAATLEQWSGTAVVDVGRLQEDTASGPLAAASTAVLLVGRPTAEGLHQLAERARALTTRLGAEHRDRSPVAVALICPAKQQKACLAALRAQLNADPATSQVAVAGFIADDPQTIELLRQGVVTKKLVSSELLRSAGNVVNTMLSWWPELRVPAAQPAADLPSRRGSEPVDPAASLVRWGPADAVDLNANRSADRTSSDAQSGRSSVVTGGSQ